jgi:hypothetical protein
MKCVFCEVLGISGSSGEAQHATSSQLVCCKLRVRASMDQSIDIKFGKMYGFIPLEYV